MKIIADLIDQFDPDQPNFRPTEIYNENWLLKGFLHQVSKTKLSNSPFSFLNGANWFSEALLPTAFKARYRGDKLAETRTHADGVIGHIHIGKKAKADLELDQCTKQFVVIEAKINAPLKEGTTNAKKFDQAARNVACMAEVLSRSNMSPRKLKKLAFIVLAPMHWIEAKRFSNEMNRNKMRSKIKNRVDAYDGDLDDWYKEWAKPTLASISIHTISWEQAIFDLKKQKSKAAASLQQFYERCLKFN